MLDVTANDRDRAYIAMAINTGLRAIRICVGDVDLAEGAIKVTISKTTEEDELPASGPGSSLSRQTRRRLPLVPD